MRLSVDANCLSRVDERFRFLSWIINRTFGRHYKAYTYVLLIFRSWSIPASMSSNFSLGCARSMSIRGTGGATDIFRDFKTLSMMSQADLKESWKRIIRDPFRSISRQRFLPNSSSLPVATFSLIRFHIVVAITTLFLESPPHKVSNNSVFLCGEPTQRLSEIRCMYTIPAARQLGWLPGK